MSEPMKVNCGYADADITAIYDGRTSALTQTPYLSGRNEVAIALSGPEAASLAAAVKVGDRIRIRCDIGIKTDDKDASPVVKPILTQNSSAYYLMKNGEDYSQTPGAAASVHSKFDPMTFAVLDKDCRKVWLVVVDGRQDWYSTGVKGYEVYRIAKKLGGWTCTRFDGGGSSCMWLYDNGSGKIVNSVSDSRGERSCLNYLLITGK
uniref:phosphodiester glycosidase family protein n=1 Tax=Candidatus Cryptobacteroides bacterium TaxID=3085639 RepID=UPI003FEDBA95